MASGSSKEGTNKGAKAHKGSTPYTLLNNLKQSKHLKQSIMSNLLTIERAFLSIPAVKQGLKIAEFKTLQRNVENAQKRKFDSTLDLSKVVLASFEWFKSAEGQALCSEEGISWSSEDFANKVFGFQKSFFYKLTRAGKLETHLVDEFKRKCVELESEGQTPNRTLEGLLKYAKEVEVTNTAGGQAKGESEGEGESEAQVSTRPQVVLVLENKFTGHKYQVLSDGSVKMSEGMTAENVKELLASIYRTLS
jgi:hypothetical protein